MKVSEWLREYQLTGRVPDHPDEEPTFAFWCGFLIGAARRERQVEPAGTTEDERIARGAAQNLEMAIRIAEFIERQATT